jgi:hypothetical protein
MLFETNSIFFILYWFLESHFVKFGHHMILHISSVLKHLNVFVFPEKVSCYF